MALNDVEARQTAPAEGRAPRGRLAVSCAGLTKHFHGVPVVANVDIDVPQGMVVGLVGPNGSGKSTTLRLLSDLLKPDFGWVDRPNPGLSYVPDDPSGLDELTVEEFLLLHCSLYRNPKNYRRRADALLYAFNLADRGRSPLASLSHGMRRQVSITAGLAAEQPLTVVDEAAAALDPEAVLVLRHSLRLHTSGDLAVLLATQDLSFAQRACDVVYLLNFGEVVAQGSPAELIKHFGLGPNSDLEQVFVAAVGARVDEEALRDALAR
jgi:ABC-type multidrug transport system ATPase subunit